MTALTFARRPSTLAFMTRAFYPASLRGPLPFPKLTASWKYGVVSDETRAQLEAFTGLAPGPELSVLCPHILGFPLVMVLLTHPSFPVPIWRTLQIRNRLVQRRPIAASAELELEARVGETRVLEKGVELELHTAVKAGGVPSWESTLTFLYRGRFPGACAPSPNASAPRVEGEEIARWTTPATGGRLGGQLTGDYNGIHLFRSYARMMGFKHALHHPQALLGQSLARLDARGPLQLEAWLKGTVRYGAEVSLRRAQEGDATTFALFAGDERPAIVGRLRDCEEISRGERKLSPERSRRAGSHSGPFDSAQG